MPRPVTTSELLLQQAVDLLTEVRDLLSSAQPVPPAPPTPPAEQPSPARPAATGKPNGRRTSPRKP